MPSKITLLLLKVRNYLDQARWHDHLTLDNMLKTYNDPIITYEREILHGFKYHLQGDNELAYRRLYGTMKYIDVQKNPNLAFWANIYLTQVQIILHDDKAEKTATQAFELARLLGDDKKLTIAYTVLAWALYSRNYFNSALEYIKFADSVQVQKGVLTQALLLECQAMCMFHLGDISLAINKLNEALFIKEANYLRAWIPQIYNRMGNVNVKLGYYKKALNHYIKSHSISVEIGNYRHQAIAYKNMGTLERRRGNFQKAEENLRNAFLAQEKISSKSEGTFAGNIVTSLAEIYLDIGDMKKARQYFKEALNHLKGFDQSRVYNTLLLGLGLVEGISGSYLKAISLLHDATEKIRITSDLPALFQAYSYFARIEHLEGNFEEAETYYKHCIDIALKAQIKADYIPTMSNYILFLLDIGENDTAIQIIKSLEDELSTSLDFSDIDETYLLLSRGAIELENDNLSIAENYLNKTTERSERIGALSLLIKGKVFNTQLLLKRYQLNKKSRFYLNAKQNIDQAITLAREGQLNQILIEMLLVRAEMYASEQKFEKSFEINKECQQIAQKLGLDSILNESKLQWELLNERKSTIESLGQTGPLLLSDLTTKTVFQKLHLASGRQIRSKLIKEDTFCIFFKISDQGSDVINSDKLPAEEETNYAQETVHLNMGALLLSALGAGHDYNTGLFGPLPFIGNQEYSVLVYAMMLPDRDQNDPRLAGESYCLFCIVYPKDINPDRNLIKKNLDNWQRKNLGDFRENDFKILKNTILNPINLIN
ncbi:MAG: tetratricopeptide repeat protein [Candidatus Hodarchaeales archaeon]|jgi:tetratricopeptide (TPR) repeat protein